MEPWQQTLIGIVTIALFVGGMVKYFFFDTTEKAKFFTIVLTAVLCLAAIVIGAILVLLFAG